MDPTTLQAILTSVLGLMDYIETFGDEELPEEVIETRTELRRELVRLAEDLG